jgi:hypothetical protein
LDEVGCHAAEM